MIDLGSLLHNHFNRYPLMQVQDLYKLLHQAAMGSEHAVVDETSARRWLEKEWESMGDGPEEPLLDPISPDGALARLHLRPCLAAGVDREAILAAFLQTAQGWIGSQAALQEYGQLAAEQAGKENWSINQQEITIFFGKMEKEGYPARHHSPGFAAAYRPAYRVVGTEIWRQYESFQFSP